MSESILNGKKILAVDDEPDVLNVLETEIMDACPNCTFDKAASYGEAIQKLESEQYDIAILDIMGVRGFDLLEIAVKKQIKVAMLTAHALSAEALKRSHDLGARAYLPKERLGEIVPFLEDMLKYEFKTGWERLLEKLHDFFAEKFEPDWHKIDFP